jgi:hypothetical protein
MLLLLLRTTKENKGFIWPEKGCLRLVIKERYKKCYKKVYT